MRLFKYNYNKILFNFFIIVLIIYPYIFLINMLLPQVDIIGKNFYVVIITLIIILILLGNIRYISSTKGIIIILAFSLILPLMIILLRCLVYDESLNNIFAARSPITFIIYLLVASVIQRTKKEKEIVCKVIIVNCFIQAIIGIIHYYFFSFILTGVFVESMDVPYIISTEAIYSREQGILLNSSLYANFILLGLFLLVNKTKIVVNKKNSYLHYFLIAIMIWGIVLSGSRYPIFISLILVVGYLFSKKRSLLVQIFIVCISITFFVYFLYPYLSGIIGRFLTEGTGGRGLKYLLALKLLFEKNILYLLLGVAPGIVGKTITDNGLCFSDNSFLEIMLLYGVPFFIIWSTFIVVLNKKVVLLKKNTFILLYFIGCLLLTNSILWEIWILYYWAALYSMQPVYDSRA